MRHNDSLWLLAAVCLVSFPLAAPAANTPAFAVSASNVTMPGGKAAGSTQFTLTSVNGYAGKLVVSCGYSGGEMNPRVPTCGSGTSVLYTLNANQSLHGTLSVYPYGSAIPVIVHKKPGARAPFALALLIFGISSAGVRHLRRRRVLLLALAAVLSAGLASCGGSDLSGTFPYTVTATDIATNVSVNASITVTVP